MSKLTPATGQLNRRKKRFAFSGPLLMASVSTVALFVGAPQTEARSLGPQAPAA